MHTGMCTEWSETCSKTCTGVSSAKSSLKDIRGNNAKYV